MPTQGVGDNQRVGDQINMSDLKLELLMGQKADLPNVTFRWFILLIVLPSVSVPCAGSIKVFNDSNFVLAVLHALNSFDGQNGTRKYMAKWTHFDTIYARMEVAAHCAQNQQNRERAEPIPIWGFQRYCGYAGESRAAAAARNLQSLPIRRRRGPQDLACRQFPI